MEFTCRHTYENDYFQEWTGNWELLHYDGSFWELLINGRGSSFHSILGMSSVGLYICIPSIDVGCSLAGWTDTFWNTENVQFCFCYRCSDNSRSPAQLWTVLIQILPQIV